MREENFLTDRLYVPSNYSKAYHQYGKNQIKFVQPFLTSIAQSCHFGHQFHVNKVLQAVSKFFLLNEIEVVFLAYLIRSTGWDIQENIIASNAQSIQDIVCYPNDSIDYKKTILYLMVSAYTVKYYLNSHTQEALEEATKRCPNFKKVFECWAKKHLNIINIINPRILHIVYQELYTNIRNEKKDFNLMVDSILQISPAYNPEKDRSKKEDKKKNHKFQPHHHQLFNHQQNNGFIPAHPLFSTHQVLRVFQTQSQNNEKNLIKQPPPNLFVPFNVENPSEKNIPLLNFPTSDNKKSSLRKRADYKDFEDDEGGQLIEGKEDEKEHQGRYRRINKSSEKYFLTEEKINSQEAEKRGN